RSTDRRAREEGSDLRLSAGRPLMSDSSTVAPFYKGWHLFNASLIDAIAPLSAAQLALPVGKADWPIWASASHLAGTRVFWLCHIFKEPGAETTPFTDPNVGWEDDLSHPRGADELVHRLARHGVLEPEASAVRLRNAPADVQPETGPAVAPAARRLVEGLEELCALVCVDAAAMVGHAHDDLVALQRQRDVDGRI